MIEKISRYRVIKVLGEGGFGVVYHAYDPKLDRSVAIKVLNRASLEDEETKARFHREAMTTGGANHPNIVNIFELGLETNEPYIVMEFLPGVDLQEVIENIDEWSLAARIGFVEEAARGLAFAHSKSIIHRDIKPANVRIGTGIHHFVKLLDFGIAHIPSSHLTKTKTLMGTPKYMSPEQSQGTGKITFASDLFSMGVALFEVATGRHPFARKGDNPITTIFRIATEPAPLVAELVPGAPQSIDDVLAGALQKKIEDRRWDASEFAEDLKAIRVNLEIAELDESKRILRQVLELKKRTAHPMIVQHAETIEDQLHHFTAGKDGHLLRKWRRLMPQIEGGEKVEIPLIEDLPKVRKDRLGKPQSTSSEMLGKTDKDRRHEIHQMLEAGLLEKSYSAALKWIRKSPHSSAAKEMISRIERAMTESGTANEAAPKAKEKAPEPAPMDFKTLLNEIVNGRGERIENALIVSWRSNDFDQLLHKLTHIELPTAGKLQISEELLKLAGLWKAEFIRMYMQIFNSWTPPPRYSGRWNELRKAISQELEFEEDFRQNGEQKDWRRSRIVASNAIGQSPRADQWQRRIEEIDLQLERSQHLVASIESIARSGGGDLSAAKEELQQADPFHPYFFRSEAENEPAKQIAVTWGRFSKMAKSLIRKKAK